MRKKFFIFGLFFVFVFTIWGQTKTDAEFPEPMQPLRLVNDFAGMLTNAECDSLEARLVAFEHQSSTQIAIVSVSNLHGYDANEYATQLFERWKIGQDGKDNGILILLKPKTEDSAGQVFICTGYGIEGVVPDATAHDIVNKEMIPHFKEGNVYAGVNAAITTLIALTTSEYSAEEYSDESLSWDEWVLLIGLVVVILIISLCKRGGKGGTGGTGHIHKSGMGPIFFGGGSFPGKSSSRGGSSDLGGFGGFGGGSTGGGGAGGSW